MCTGAASVGLSKVRLGSQWLGGKGHLIGPAKKDAKLYRLACC